MKYFFYFFAVAVLVSCKVPKSEPENRTDVPKTNIKTVIATVKVETFENKAGRVINGVNDHYLVYEGQNWFIKFMESPVPPSEVEKYIDSTVTCGVTEMEGLWDTDNPEQQSRVGKYVVLHSISTK